MPEITEKDNMKEMVIKADTQNLYQVLDFVDAELEEAGCGMREKMQIDIAVEEIFVNISNYAYPKDRESDADSCVPNASGMGNATIRVAPLEGRKGVSITFMDSGSPFDPLKRSDPDMDVPLEERGVGGLGIFMVKKSMTDMRYEYKDGMNCLTLEKEF